MPHDRGSEHFEKAYEAIYRIEDMEELKKLNALVIQQMRALGRRTARTMHVGMRVKVKSDRRHVPFYGVITKIGQKNVVVREDNAGLWRVHAANCEPA